MYVALVHPVFFVPQGAANNAQGLGAELAVAEQAPGVIAISRKFWSTRLAETRGEFSSLNGQN